MNKPTLHEYLTRIGRLLQAEERSDGSGLQPVQRHALDYLSRCNRYSDRPAAVAEYLGITKGTASQTLRVLMEAGLIDKQVDPDDRRSVHLTLTPLGHTTVEDSGSRLLIDQALTTLPSTARSQLESLLPQLLRALQAVNGGRSFGVCRTCRHFRCEGEGLYRCGLTSEPLAVHETALVCREHDVS